jgi:hypothetical protein
MASWFYVRNNQQVGPVSLEQLQAMVSNGQLRADDRVWGEGMPDWVFVQAVPELQAVGSLQPVNSQWPGTGGGDATLPYQTTARYPSPKTRAKWTNMLLGVLIAMQVLMIPATMMIPLVSAPPPGTRLSPAEATKLIAMGLSMCGVSLLYLLALGGCAVAFPMWMHRANRAARALGTQGMEFTPGWAAGWFFVPFANLVMPYRAMVELWKASDPQLAPGGRWQATTVAPIVGLWWTFWIGSNMVAWAGNVVQRIGGQTQIAGVVLLCLSAALGVVAAVFAMKVIRGVTDRLEERAMRQPGQ